MTTRLIGIICPQSTVCGVTVVAFSRKKAQPYCRGWKLRSAIRGDEPVWDTGETRESQVFLPSSNGEGRTHRMSGLRDGMPQARGEACAM
jgi:hypothetical protein